MQERVGNNGCSVYRKARKKTRISKRCSYRTIMSPVNHWENVVLRYLATGQLCINYLL